MKKMDKAKQGARKSSVQSEDDQPDGNASRAAKGADAPELLPSDTNDAADISPRIAFLAYN
jgi:hypothetical protein